MPTAFLVSLFEHKAWCNRRLAEALAAAPADADRLEMSIVLLTFEHTWRVDRVFKARLEGAAPDLDAVVGARRPDIAELAAEMAELDAWYLDYARRVTPAELETEVVFNYVSDPDEGRMTKGEILAHVITHGASHRGAVGKMLERLGVAGASDMVTTFTRERREGRA